MNNQDTAISQCHSLYVVSWSHSSPIPFHVEQVSDMLKTNLNAMTNKYPVDFIPIAFATSFESAQAILRELEEKLK